MPLFQYKAENKNGKIISDGITAVNEEDAAQLLQEKGYKVLSIKKRKKEASLFDNFLTIPVIEKATLCRHLSIMLKAALPINEAFEIFISETEDKRMQAILEDIYYGIKKGESLSDGFSRFPNVFDKVFITMIEAGEESGKMEETFDYLATQLMSQHQLTQKVKGALAYPIVVLTAMVAVGIAMMTFVLPKIGNVFISMNIDIPLPTQILLSVSKWLGNHALFVVAGFVLSIVGFVVLMKVSSTRRAIMNFLSKMPIINRLMEHLDLARFSRTLSLLLATGVPIIKALNVSALTLSQNKFDKFSEHFNKKIKKGTSLSIILEEEKVFPPIMMQTIKAGEESGTLDEILMDLATFYEEEVETSLKKFVSLLEPALMLIIGVAVGAMVISIIGPIYSVVGNLQGQAGSSL